MRKEKFRVNNLGNLNINDQFEKVLANIIGKIGKVKFKSQYKDFFE